MKPIGELNRSPVLVLYWVLFGGGGNCGVGKACGGSRRDGLGHCRAAAKCAHAVRGSAQVVCRPAARGVVGEWAHTASEPCREGGASALVTEAGKVMSYPSGGSDRAAESRCGSWFLSAVTGRQNLDADHGSYPALGTKPQVFGGAGRIKIPVILGHGKQVRGGSRCCRQSCSLPARWQLASKPK